jgi:hypothetical protein
MYLILHLHLQQNPRLEQFRYVSPVGSQTAKTEHVSHVSWSGHFSEDMNVLACQISLSYLTLA